MRGIAVSAATLGLASAAWQKAGERRDRRRYPPPGRLVNVGGHRLHIVCAGKGSPTVVVIPAMGAGALDWRDVQRTIAAKTAICVYDRAGLGWSDSALGLPTAVGMARELRTLLGNAGIRPPFVLVGHSLGGLVARVFTHLYPGEVAALALVDSSHPDQPQRLPKVWLRDHRGGKLAEVALEYARPLGLRRTVQTLRAETGTGALTALALSSCKRRAWLKELLAFDAICRQTAAAGRSLRNVPLAVVTSSERDPKLRRGSRAQRARSRFYPAWAALQNELTRLSPDSVHLVSESAGHHVQRDDPQLVINAITGLLERVR